MITRKSSNCPIKMWVAEPPPPQVKDLILRNSRLLDVQYMAIMPDVHLSKNVCVGSVIATSRLIYPEAIGQNIGCGMTSIGFNCLAKEIVNSKNFEKILSLLHENVPIMRHSTLTEAPKIPVGILANQLSSPKLANYAVREGRISLGTLGRGNHFVEFQQDDQGLLWLMVHSGSRVMGQKISAFHQNLNNSGRKQPYSLNPDTDEGKMWLNDMNWAISFAEANRMQILHQITNFMQLSFGIEKLPNSLISSNHDHISQEIHFGKKWWIHRKGANNTTPSQPVIVAGSMGSPSFHVIGRNSEASLHSCSHGAGRVMSRTEARKSVSISALSREMKGIYFNTMLSKSLCEEAPSAYKNINKVMRAQKQITKKVRTLYPLLSYKGG